MRIRFVGSEQACRWVAVFVVDVKRNVNENDSGLGETKSILILEYYMSVDVIVNR